LRLPHAKVMAFDTDANAQAICRQMATENGVAGRIEIGGYCTADQLAAAVANAGSALLVMDCEGGELDLLSDGIIVGMRECDVIVECHDFIRKGITEALMERFATSHRVQRVGEGSRDPNQFPLLHDRSSLERWLAICEFRPEVMNWLVCWAPRKD